MAQKKHQSKGSPLNRLSKTEERELKAREKSKKRTLVIVALVIGLLLVAGITFGVVQQQARVIYDLSVVGQGVPVVVQVHDTSCPICTQLKETIHGMRSEFTDSQLLIRIADISNPEAVRFIEPYTTNRRVTLLFFNGQGELVNTLVGAQTTVGLREAFRELMGSN
jgi:hypothetical protein